MSGMRGSARNGKIKVQATIRFADTGRRVRTNIFISFDDTAFDVVERITNKYEKSLEVLSLRTADPYRTPLFDSPKKAA